MNDPKPVPLEIKLEQSNLELEKLRGQIVKAAGLIQDLTIQVSEMEAIGMLMISGLKRITEIKGSPPIQVARTMAQQVIDMCANHLKETKHETSSTNHNPDHSGPVVASENSQHEVRDLPSGAG